MKSFNGVFFILLCCCYPTEISPHFTDTSEPKTTEFNGEGEYSGYLEGSTTSPFFTTGLPTTGITTEIDETIGSDRVDEKIMFITNKFYNGNKLGTLTGADIICNQEAFEANLIGQISDYNNPSNYPFRAWLSGDEYTDGGLIFQSAIERIRLHETAVYRRLDGKIIAHGGSQLLSGKLEYPISIDSFGNEIEESRVWTNTSSNGIGYSKENDCDNWTDYYALSFSYVGRSSAIDKNWTMLEIYAEQNCGAQARLYCVEQ